MISIIKRLLESRDTMSTDIFNVARHSDEAVDLYADLREKVIIVLRRYSDDIDLDDDGLNGGNGQVVIYKAKVYRYDRGREIPLPKKDVESIESELLKAITLPASDDEYEYSVDATILGKDLSVTLRREEK